MFRIVLVVVALVVAVFSAWMVQRYLASERAKFEQLASSRQGEAPPVATVEVLVLASDLPVASILQPAGVAWQPWHTDKLNPRYITRSARPQAIEQLIGSTTRLPLYAGAPVIEESLVKRGDSGFLAAVLGNGQRAVALKVNSDAEAMAGWIQPGDRVDVILTHNIPDVAPGVDSGGAKERRVGETIIRDVRVVAVDQALKVDPGSTPKVGKTVIVEVDQRQAVAFQLGLKMGTLSLSLRSAFGRTDGDLEPLVIEDTDISAWSRASRGRAMRVLTASRDLAKGTLLSESDLNWAGLNGKVDPDKHLVEGRDEMRGFRGALVTDEVAKGAPLMRTALIRPGDGRFISEALQPGMRGVSIATQAPSGVSGLITPGDYVDVVMTGKVSKDPILDPRHYGETIATGVRLLSIESKNNPETGLPQSGATATLEVPPKLAEGIILASQAGLLVLTARPSADLPPATAVRPGKPFDLVSYVFKQSYLPFTTDLSMSGALRWLASSMDSPPMMVMRTLNRLDPLTMSGLAGTNGPQRMVIYRGTAPQVFAVGR